MIPIDRTIVRRTIVVVLATANAALLLFALRMGPEIVRDGAGSVTTGYNIAISVGITLLVVMALRWARLSTTLRSSVRIYALCAQAAHATGHLARWYYEYRWFDDVLHVTLVFGAALLALRVAQGSGIFPLHHATPLRAALVVIVASLAIAAAWEIFEFTMDTVQTSREQDDLTDTMLDMIAGALGGLFAAAWAACRPRPSSSALGRSHQTPWMGAAAAGPAGHAQRARPRRRWARARERGRP